MQRPRFHVALAFIVAGALTLFVLVLAADLGGSSPGGRAVAAGRPAGCPGARAGFDWYRRHAARWRWQTGEARSLHPAVGAHAFAPCSQIRPAARAWRIRARIARRDFERWFAETYERWACIHAGEGAWNANTGNGYYGGLQFDTSFMAAYGPEFVRRWGYAHRWPVWSQLVCAERARRVRGFAPWPTTGARCGLI